MNATPRIGELLARLGQLSPHDIDEILAEQRAAPNHARFGTLAVSLGFCQPEHVWAAWCDQLGGRIDTIDLERVGVDAQAIECLPRRRAHELRAIPVRLWEGQLVVAVADAARAPAVRALAGELGANVRCVLADAAQIERALEKYYPAADVVN